MKNALAVLKSLADENRLKIIELLLKNDLCVGALARRLDLSEAAVSQHLKILREAGLVTGKKKSYYMHYTVDNEKLTDLSAYLNELASLEKQSGQEKERLNEHCFSD